MKTIEEKAKAYDEALKAAIAAHKDEDRHLKATLERIFPELQESEDERIRKGLIKALSSIGKRNWGGIDVFESISWLEKQGEHKLTDKIEPKFKVGDWIANDYCTGKVIALTDDAYLLDSGQGIPFSCEHNAHLWTIDDAKDGDVLVDDLGNICIYKESPFSLNSMYYSYCYGNHKYFVDGGGSHVIVDTCPASKEQRNILFQKMKEEGYQWDAKKKELKLLISNGGDFESNNSKQKSTWSEEDERLRYSCIKHIEEELEEIRKDRFGHSEIISDLKEECRERIDWLKSLKERLS